MTDIQLAGHHHNAQQDGPVVWILSTGELSEGGNIVGVYLDRDLAYGDFMDQARQIDDRFGIDTVRPEDDGQTNYRRSLPSA